MNVTYCLLGQKKCNSTKVTLVWQNLNLTENNLDKKIMQKTQKTNRKTNSSFPLKMFQKQKKTHRSLYQYLKNIIATH